ncbi:MAG TPA: type VI secretion system tip protein TssI/VgrG [Sphingomonas sp.]|jgi:type VI secretion system secreted protein VgrG|uniref:type VI secretion system tip protein TssI/VgrG n=1 Tax=Sphingomonas sp. TaxID=28214 RepID=UPI002ED89D89
MGARDGNRFLHILEAPGDVQNYKLFRMEGQEQISTAEGFRLTIRSEGDVPPASAWLNASITFSLGMSDDSERRINGRCARFEHLYHKGNYVEFAILVEPAFAALKLTRDRRLFTDKSHKQVVETILREHQITFDDSRYGPSQTRPYIVQQDESDFDFICRLLADEGVFYYFRFDEGAAPYKHRMSIAGDPAGYYDGDPFQLSFRRDHLLRGLQDLQMGYDSAPAAVMTHDYDFKKPGDLSPIKAPSKLDWAARNGHVYHWATDYEDPGAGRDRAKLRIEGAESAAVIMRGTGSYVAFAPGARFQVDDTRLDPRERRIVIRSVHHDAFDPYSSAEGEPHYSQSFEAQPSTQPFRPKRSVAPVASRGPQTATVVDQTDPEGYGRVKIKFHWDRTGASTCWVRVLQQWAGDGIGSQFVPRPGMEVLVDFIDGRPDRPVIVGSLFNGRNKHAFAVPANLTQAGFRTFGDGGKVNEFLFEDKGGGEEIYLHAGRDFRRDVKQNESSRIVGTQAVRAQNVDIKVENRIDLRADQAINISVGASKITITSGGIWIDAPVVNINTGTSPAFPNLAEPPAAKAVGPAPAPPAIAAGPGSGAAAPPPTPSAEALAKKLVQPGGSATQTDVNAVVGELKKMPVPALQSLEKSNVKVIAARGSVTDYATELKGVQPRGWPPGKTWDSVPGAYMPGHNAVVIATTGSGANTHVPTTGNGHGSVSLVVHEATHAIDNNIGAKLNSSNATFLSARAKDLGVLSAYESQPGIAGPSETYAESAARFYGGSNVNSKTPALDAYWRANPLGGK